MDFKYLQCRKIWLLLIEKRTNLKKHVKQKPTNNKINSCKTSFKTYKIENELK